jgi:vacuolar iron transporter family protein
VWWKASLTIYSLGSARLVVIGGLAELFSGAISIGLGAYLATATERDHYIAEGKGERDEIAAKPDAERGEIYKIMMSYGIGRDAITPLISALETNVEEWVRVRFSVTYSIYKI